MRVIIIGAGIAGLAMAGACKQLGIDVCVYEKAKALKHIGGGLLIWPHALHYLKELGLADCLMPYYVNVKGCNMVGVNGQIIFGEDYQHFYSLIDGEVLPIERSLLQQTLLAKLSSETVKLNKTCLDVIEEEKHVRVKFTDGTEDIANLVVGADGIHSVIRNSININSRVQQTAYGWLGGIIKQHDVPDLAINKVFVALGLGKMCVAWPVANDRFMWYLPVKLPNKKFENKESLLKQLYGWNKIVDHILNAESIEEPFYQPIALVEPQVNLSNKRITLIGDAAHTLGPVLGQGANLAIEDVYVLINCLQTSVNNIPKALQNYSQLRFEKANKLFELENQSAETMMTNDLEVLHFFEQQLKHLNLEMLYQDLIPLVNRQSCLELTNTIKQPFYN